MLQIILSCVFNNFCKVIFQHVAKSISDSVELIENPNLMYTCIEYSISFFIKNYEFIITSYNYYDYFRVFPSEFGQ